MVLPRVLLGRDVRAVRRRRHESDLVAVLSVFVLIEKIGPAGVAVARVAGAVMIVAGFLVLSGIR